MAYLTHGLIVIDQRWAAFPVLRANFRLRIVGAGYLFLPSSPISPSMIDRSISKVPFISILPNLNGTSSFELR